MIVVVFVFKMPSLSKLSVIRFLQIKEDVLDNKKADWIKVLKRLQDDNILKILGLCGTQLISELHDANYEISSFLEESDILFQMEKKYLTNNHFINYLSREMIIFLFKNRIDILPRLYRPIFKALIFRMSKYPSLECNDICSQTLLISYIKHNINKDWTDMSSIIDDWIQFAKSHKKKKDKVLKYFNPKMFELNRFISKNIKQLEPVNENVTCVVQCGMIATHVMVCRQCRKITCADCYIKIGERTLSVGTMPTCPLCRHRNFEQSSLSMEILFDTFYPEWFKVLKFNNMNSVDMEEILEVVDLVRH